MTSLCHHWTFGLCAAALAIGAAGAAPDVDCNGNGVPDSTEIAPRFASHPIYGPAPGASGAFPADLDGDGDPDVAWTSNYDDLVAWSENVDGQGTFGPPTTLATAFGASAAMAADPNQDDRLDVVWAASLSYTTFTVAWHENLGGGLYGPALPIDDDFGARSMAPGDFDGDGDTDFAVGSYYTGQLIWYEATGGSVGFGSAHAVATGAGLDEPTSVVAADLNGDDALDLLVASQGNDSVRWYAGDGSGGFTGNAPLPVVADGPRSVFAADLDGDGDRDVLVASFHDGRVTWYRNNGSGSFTPAGTIQASSKAAQSVIAVDLDVDGDNDVVAAFATRATGPGAHSDCCGPGFVGCSDTQCQQNICLFDGYCCDVEWDQICADEAIADPDCNTGCGGGPGLILWFENLTGAGAFGPARMVSNEETGPWALASADVDRDGDADVVTAAFVSDRVVWHENQIRDCNDNDVPDDCDITGGVATDCDANGVPDSCDLAAGAASDCNGNSVSDACDVTGGGSSDCTGNAVPDECEADCDGDGSADSCEIAGGAADVDTDGIPDACEPDCNGNGLPDDFDVTQGAADCDGNRVPDTCQPDCDGNGAVDACDTAVGLTGHAISQGTLAFVYDVFTGDVDGDGDLDVVAASGSDHDKRVAWYENLDGHGSFGPALIVGTMFKGLPAIDGADVDGDDDLDVLFAVGWTDTVAWFENVDGQGTFGPVQTISNAPDFPEAVFPADVDGDGRMDVLSTSQFANKVYWHRNVSGDGTVWSTAVVGSLIGPADVEAVDLDGDLDLDLAVAGFFHVAWAENLDGAGAFAPLQPVGPSIEGGGMLHAADVDGDAAVDIVAGSDDGVAWLRNLGGGSFDHVLAAPTSGVALHSVRVADLDGDGDGDLVYSSDAELAWVENLGSGVFGPKHVLSTTAYTWGIDGEDLDADGDADVVTVQAKPNPPSPDLVLWYENESDDCDGDAVPDVCEPDCDADGLIDACDPITTDTDSDGVCDAADCAPASAQAWSPTTPARSLMLAKTGGPTVLTWQPPASPGGSASWYDVLRSPAASDFFADTLCLETDDLDLTATDGDEPAPGGVFHYLIRAQNACPASEGNLGASSAGTPRSGIACP